LTLDHQAPPYVFSRRFTLLHDLPQLFFVHAL